MTARAPLFDVLVSRSTDAALPPRASGASSPSLRESLRRELALLFNSTALALDEPERFAHAARSTLGYGLPPLAGRAASSLDHEQLAAQLALAIRRFEPRLQPESLRVRPRAGSAVRHNVLGFEIDGRLRDSLGPDVIELDSELDLESGVATVRARRRPRSPSSPAQG